MIDNPVLSKILKSGAGVNIKAVEWFDDRFYKIDFETINEELLQKYGYPLTGSDYFKSSTTYLGAAPKPWLGRWRGDIGNWEADRVMRDKADHGSTVHHAAYDGLQGAKIIFNNSKHPAYNSDEIAGLREEYKQLVIIEDQQTALELWRLKQFFMELQPLEVVALEMTVVSLKYKFAGTLDCLLKIKAGTYYFDRTPLEIEKDCYVVIDFKTGQEDHTTHSKQLASYRVAVEEDTDFKIDYAFIVHTNAKSKTGIDGLKVVCFDKAELDRSFEIFTHLQIISNEWIDEKPKFVEIPSIINFQDLPKIERESKEKKKAKPKNSSSKSADEILAEIKLKKGAGK